MDDAVFSDLEADAVKAAAAYREMREDAEAAVVRWSWATPVASLHEAQPLFAERFEQEIGSLLPGRRSNEDTLYGFDALERIVLARTHDGTGDPDTETFRERAGETVRTVTFELPAANSVLPPRPKLLTREFWQDGRLVGMASLTPSRRETVHSRETYEYDDHGRVVRINAQRIVDPPESDDPDEVPEWQRVDVRYDGLGLVSIENVTADGRRFPIWFRARPATP